MQLYTRALLYEGSALGLPSPTRARSIKIYMIGITLLKGGLVKGHNVLPRDPKRRCIESAETYGRLRVRTPR
jgi:hypothetical protein